MMRTAPPPEPPSRVWIFDLDNTLHDASVHIFPHISRSMTAYLAERLQLAEDDASALRVRYWQRYGATLLGMMRHHDTDPRHFLWHTHQFPDLSPMVVVERGLRHALTRLRGRKIVFSNAPQRYAEDVLSIMGVRGLFDQVCSIERMCFRPKPAIQGFLRLLREHRLRGCEKFALSPRRRRCATGIMPWSLCDQATNDGIDPGAIHRRAERRSEGQCRQA